MQIQTPDESVCGEDSFIFFFEKFWSPVLGCGKFLWSWNMPLDNKNSSMRYMNGKEKEHLFKTYKMSKDIQILYTMYRMFALQQVPRIILIIIFDNLNNILRAVLFESWSSKQMTLFHNYCLWVVVGMCLWDSELLVLNAEQFLWWLWIKAVKSLLFAALTSKRPLRNRM